MFARAVNVNLQESSYNALCSQIVLAINEFYVEVSELKYTLKYTFPRKIVKSSIDDATYSLDAKTIEVTRSFVAYMKDPNVLDLEIELEK